MNWIYAPCSSIRTKILYELNLCLTLNVGSYFHLYYQISYIGQYVWIQNDTFEIQIVDKIEKHMRYESAWAYLELFLSTVIFEFVLIWFAAVFDSLSDWNASMERERERTHNFFVGKIWIEWENWYRIYTK